MARFYGNIQGNRKEKTTLGSKNSGLIGHLRGWNIGIKINCCVDKNDKDIVTVYLTSGSNNKSCDKLIGTFIEE